MRRVDPAVAGGWLIILALCAAALWVLVVAARSLV